MGRMRFIIGLITLVLGGATLSAGSPCPHLQCPSCLQTERRTSGSCCSTTSVPETQCILAESGGGCPCALAPLSTDDPGDKAVVVPAGVQVVHFERLDVVVDLCVVEIGSKCDHPCDVRVRGPPEGGLGAPRAPPMV